MQCVQVKGRFIVQLLEREECFCRRFTDVEVFTEQVLDQQRIVLRLIDFMGQLLFIFDTA